MDVSKGALITRDPLSSEQSSRQCRPPGSQSDVSRRRTQPRDSRVHHTWLPHTQRLPLARLPLTFGPSFSAPPYPRNGNSTCITDTIYASVLLPRTTQFGTYTTRLEALPGFSLHGCCWLSAHFSVVSTFLLSLPFDAF